MMQTARPPQTYRARWTALLLSLVLCGCPAASQPTVARPTPPETPVDGDASPRGEATPRTRAAINWLRRVPKPAAILLLLNPHRAAAATYRAYAKGLATAAGLELQELDPLVDVPLAREYRVSGDALVVMAGASSVTMHFAKETDTEKLDVRLVERVRRTLERPDIYVAGADGSYSKMLPLAGAFGTVHELASGWTSVPDSAGLFILMVTSDALQPSQSDAVARMLARGGRALIAVEASAGIAPELTKPLGVVLNGATLASEKILFRLRNNVSDKTILAPNGFSEHAAVATLYRNRHRGVALLFSRAASWDIVGASGVKVTPLVSTRATTFRDFNGNYQRDSDDHEGRFAVAVASERTGQHRAVLVADTDMFTDTVLDAVKANRLFFAETMSWLTEPKSTARP